MLPACMKRILRPLERSRVWQRWLALLVLLSLLVGIGVGVGVHLTSSYRVVRAAPTRADLFMRSVVMRDGQLGWQQLCPDVQAQIPQIMLIRQADAQRASDLSQGVTLTMQSLGAYPLAQKGVLHLYLLTAHGPHDWEAQRAYLVRTRAGGCVADVQTMDQPEAGANS
jgi:hypothetical protein